MYYNAYKSNVDEEFCSNYENVWEKSLNCFFTKEEFYSFFRNPDEQLDNILKLISIDFYEQNEIKLAIDQAVYNNKLFLAYAIGILQNRNEWGTEEYEYV
ncbi:MAG: hypothetical protein E7163_04740 [Firmicutes bacterium]|nr:hypothetical protein [Bacillota bacterium]